MPSHPRDVFPRALASTTSATALPYGYTLVVWCSGALLMHHHGGPKVGDVFLFLLGGVLGYVATDALTAPAGEDAARASRAQQRIAGAIHLVAVAGAVGAAALLSLLDGWIAWLLVPAAATAAYLLLATLELLLARGLRR